MLRDTPMPLPADAARVSLTRRSLLGGAAGLVAGASAGCVQRTRSLLGRDVASPVSLTVKSVPADSDRAATWIARHLVEHLEAVGIDTTLVLESEDQLRRSILINHDFDLYVARYPGHRDPDSLRPLLHSVFVDEPGWQNPFGFVDLTVDEQLDRQRTLDGAARRTVVGDLLRGIARLQPFTVIAFPDDVRAVRSDRFTGWRAPGLSSPLGYLALRRASADQSTLRVVLTDERVTRNFNPLAVEFRNRGTLTGLLYDPLAHRLGDEILPWLAAEWTWDDTRDGTVARVRLRENLTWHDGRRIGAGDVAFTYALLEDTTLGEGAVPAPAPRFRGRVSLVESVTVIDERTLRFKFRDTTPAVAARAFTVPVLPEREWRPMAVPAEFSGLELFEGVTEALIWDNPEPIGSGALQFERRVVDEAIAFSRFDDHFLHRGAAPAEAFQDGVSFESLTVRIAPSDESAVELVAIDEVDGTASTVGPHVVPTIGRRDATQLVVTPSQSFYHVGYNVRQEPLGNPRFRRAIARLVDEPYLADTVLEGFASPSAAPLNETHWLPNDLRWDGEDPSVPFVGAGGELDTTSAKELFREIGYQYDEDGRLVER